MAPAEFTLTATELEDIVAFFKTHHLEEGGHFTTWVQILLAEAPVQVARATEPLYYASSYGLLPVVERLLQDGAMIDAHGGRANSTALQVACFRGHLSIVKVLLDAGADPNSTNQHGFSNLEWARSRGLPDIEKLLIKHGAKEKQKLPSRIESGKNDLLHSSWVCCCCTFEHLSVLASSSCPICGHRGCDSCRHNEWAEHLSV